MIVFIVSDCDGHRVDGFDDLELAKTSIRESHKGTDARLVFVESTINEKWLAIFSFKGKMVEQYVIRRCEIYSTAVLLLKG